MGQKPVVLLGFHCVAHVYCNNSIEHDMKSFISNSGLMYKVSSIEKIVKSVSTKGMMSAYLSGNFTYPDSMEVVEYFIKGKNDKEDFERTFVLTESEAIEKMLVCES